MAKLLESYNASKHFKPYKQRKHMIGNGGEVDDKMNDG